MDKISIADAVREHPEYRRLLVIVRVLFGSALALGALFLLVDLRIAMLLAPLWIVTIFIGLGFWFVSSGRVASSLWPAHEYGYWERTQRMAELSETVTTDVFWPLMKNGRRRPGVLGVGVLAWALGLWWWFGANGELGFPREFGVIATVAVASFMVRRMTTRS